ncbi:hypothetical protein C8R45DRAFT_403145 [Mycena sanguinolenta]|nr:hypothetical protein C8R45DRAFT_403145 [Mycena sanguinolenta]
MRPVTAAVPLRRGEGAPRVPSALERQKNGSGEGSTKSGGAKTSLLDKAVRYLLDGDNVPDRSTEEIWLMGMRLPGWVWRTRPGSLPPRVVLMVHLPSLRTDTADHPKHFGPRCFTPRSTRTSGVPIARGLSPPWPPLSGYAPRTTRVRWLPARRVSLGAWVGFLLEDCVDQLGVDGRDGGVDVTTCRARNEQRFVGM